jgi:hypothetical protein
MASINAKKIWMKGMWGSINLKQFLRRARQEYNRSLPAENTEIDPPVAAVA